MVNRLGQIWIVSPVGGIYRTYLVVSEPEPHGVLGDCRHSMLNLRTGRLYDAYEGCRNEWENDPSKYKRVA